MNNPAAVNPPSILVVDDTTANLKLLSTMLRTHGYKVRPVSSGALALQAIESCAPDLVLLDITMPDMDGYEVCRRMKADKRWSDIPVLFISALNDTTNKMRAFQEGGVDYIDKPFQFEEVEARVRTHLELRRKTQELKDNFNHLQELERLRDSLTHMIVHDMRTPLQTIQLSIEAARDSTRDNPVEAIEYCETAQKGTVALIEMVSQMLDVSRMEAGVIELHKSRSDLSATAFQVVEALRPLAQNRVLMLQAPSPVWSDFDPVLVQRVITNLLGNALKFTPKTGEISVRVSCLDGIPRLEIQDSGPGIAPEYHEKIFSKFGQVGDGSKYGGSGLGLTFCKMVIEAHQGKIGLDSSPAKGSTFWFTL